MKINKACDLSFFSILPPTPGSFLRSLLRSAISVSLIFFSAQTIESSPSEWSFLWLRICDYMDVIMMGKHSYEPEIGTLKCGDKYRGKYDASVVVVKSYYASMRKATVREEYFEYIISKARNFGGIGWAITEFSWDVKYAGLQVIASKLLILAMLLLLL